MDSRDAPVRPQAGLAWKSVSCSRGEEQSLVPMPLALALASEFTGADAGLPACLEISWFLASFCPPHHHWARSIHWEPPSDKDGGAIYFFVYVCPRRLETKVCFVSWQTHSGQTLPPWPFHTSSSLARGPSSHSLFTQKEVWQLSEGQSNWTVCFWNFIK